MPFEKLIQVIGFQPKENAKDIFIKKYQDGYIIEIDFDKKTFYFGGKIKIQGKYSQNITKPEDWVVLECVNRLLETGYKPENISLEKVYPAGRGFSGRLDICVNREDSSEYLLIECKTYGAAFDKEFSRIKKDGGQLFTYFKFANKADLIMLYTSQLINNEIVYKNEIVKIEDEYRIGDVKDFYEKWNKRTKDNGVFDAWVKSYNFESKTLNINKTSVVDLFCGIGGLSHGFVQEQLNVVAGIDNDISCRFAFEKNNNSTFISKSITDIKSSDINSLFNDAEVKILVGCAPCQNFSSYMFKDKDKESNKWKLLYEFSRLIREVQPEIVSMENVSQLLNFKKAPVFEDFISELKSLGYFVCYEVVKCPDYGIPQNRRRLILLASKLGEIKLIPKTHTKENYVTVEDAIGKLPPLKDGEKDKKDPFHYSRKLTPLNKKRIQATPYGGGWNDWDDSLKLACHKKESGKSYPSVYGRMEWNKPSPTMTTHCIGYGNGRFGHPEQDRAISLREASLLQTFPKEYRFVKDANTMNTTTIARQIGNAVPVRLGQVVAQSIKEHLKEYGKL